MRHLFLILALCAFAFSACKHDPPPQSTDDAIHAGDDAAQLPVALTADVTITHVFHAAQTQPFDVTDAQPRPAVRVAQPLAPRSILPHPAYRSGDHARNASGRFTNADC